MPTDAVHQNYFKSARDAAGRRRLSVQDSQTVAVRHHSSGPWDVEVSSPSIQTTFSEKEHIRHVDANVPGISRRARRSALLTGCITDPILRWTHPLGQTIFVCRGTVHGLISDMYRQIVAAFVVPASTRKRQE
jgi:hypothetical protein